MNIIQQITNKEDQPLKRIKHEPVSGLMLPKLSETDIPVELCEEIFSYLTGPELTNCALVGKEWYKVVNHKDRLWKGILDQYAIGPRMWQLKVSADIGKADPIPKEMLEILRQPCPFNEGKQVGQSHMLVWIPSFIDNKSLTLNSFEKFIKSKSFPDGYRYYFSEVKNHIGDKVIEKAGWVLMTKDVIPGSRKKSYIEQKKMVDQYREYEVPKTVEATFCIFAKYYCSDIRLYSDSPLTHTNCYEQAGDWQAGVGGFLPSSGLGVCPNSGAGVAAIRKFF